MAKLFAHSHQGCNICKYKLMASLNASNWCENPSTEFVSPQGYIQFWFYSFVITKRIRTKNPNLTQCNDELILLVWWVLNFCDWIDHLFLVQNPPSIIILLYLYLLSVPKVWEQSLVMWSRESKCSNVKMTNPPFHGLHQSVSNTMSLFW